MPAPVPATPNPAPAPNPNPTPAPTPAADPTRPPAVKESDARAKFAPLKAEFDRARAANDLKTMARVTGEMGMVTRDFDGTATAAEALAAIKLFGEIRAADRMREAGAEFRKAKAAAKEYNEEVAEAIANLRKLAKEAAGTTAAAEAETDIKHYLEGEAARLWGRAKGKTAGDAPEAVAACDVAARVAREFAGTDAAKEAEKALADEEKRLVEARGTSAFLVLQSALWRARDPKSVRELAGQAHVLIDAGEDAEALGGLANRALRALDRMPTPAGRPRVALNWPNANAVKRDFSGVGGAREEVVKEGDKGAVKFASPGAAVRVMAMLMQPEEDTVLKLTYKVQGIKSLTLRFASATHRAAFEYTVPNLKNDAAETLVLPLASVKKDAHSLRNAFVTLFEIRAEKAKPDDAAAALFLYSGDVNSGRAK
ncbi:MAG: hypothetical protein KIS92_26765 [Planctomycetota bacterium]|nr:hypothetical protein [Planctomycetota bacterium]